MSDVEASLPKDWSGIAPFFPLPNTVFFPGTVLPLHIFEPRYREMVRDVEGGEGLLAITLLRGDWRKDYGGAPDVEPVCTVGKLRSLEQLDDGRYNIALDGLSRVHLQEIPSDHAYRMARMTPLPDRPPQSDPQAQRQAKVELLTAYAYLQRQIRGNEDSPLLVDDQQSFAKAVCEVCAQLPVDPPSRQRLLELDRLADRHAAAKAIVHEALRQVLQMRAKDDGGDEPLLN